MTRLVRVELLKLRTVRLPLGLLITAAGLTAGFTSAEASRAGQPGTGIGSLATAAGLGSVTTVTGWSMLLAAVLGVTVASGEFRHGTATLTYLAAPGRARVLAAKAAAAACAGALFGLAAAAASTGAGLAFAAGRGYHLALGAGALAGHAAGAVLAAALLAAAGAGLGSLVRSQLAGVIGVFAWGLVIEPVLGGVFPSARPWLPYTAATTLAGISPGSGTTGFRMAVRTHAAAAVAGPLPFVTAASLVAGVAVVICAVAAATTVRRDIA